MTSHVGRLYSLAFALVVFFLTWAVVAARPWVTTSAKPDPRVQALNVRAARLQQQAVLVDRIVAARAKAAQASAAAPAPAVRVITLPPLTITRSS